jgi:hypothetical protein
MRMIIAEIRGFARAGMGFSGTVSRIATRDTLALTREIADLYPPLRINMDKNADFVIHKG